MTDDIDWTDEAKDWKALAWQYRDEIIRLEGEIERLKACMVADHECERLLNAEIERLKELING